MKYGVVVIGRNEGERLRTCLSSVKTNNIEVIYVDSGSDDNSVSLARSLSSHVVELDVSIPFTAARARNQGFKELIQRIPEAEYVQFVDGDCEIFSGWLHESMTFMSMNPDIAVACGRLHERYPEKSIYNQLCDLEWKRPAGLSKDCGGNALIRVKAFAEVNGFREDLIAGEEPELCLRLRAKGWRIWRLDEDMALHDADILVFKQWWKRTTRAGYAFAAGAFLHGKSHEKHWVRETRSAWFWGMIIPLITVSLLYLFGLWGLVVLIVYPLQVMRLTLKGAFEFRINLLQAFFLVLGKFAELLGVVNYYIDRILNARNRVVE